MLYVQSVEVVYGDSSGSLGDQDINKGFGGQYVYLVPKYTPNRSEAARAFSFHTTDVEDMCADDLSKGDGLALFRYLHAHYRPNDDDWRPPIRNVWLTEEKTPSRDENGRTDDLNKDRGGRFLFLCWAYST
ncbi:hypothetical protein F5146DRAFT_1069856 [Armillaria mellea]|nr:hypothetical protein F5146DRAFT_1069856 [Armillaria mellea]